MTAVTTHRPSVCNRQRLRFQTSERLGTAGLTNCRVSGSARGSDTAAGVSDGWSPCPKPWDKLPRLLSNCTAIWFVCMLHCSTPAAADTLQGTLQTPANCCHQGPMQNNSAAATVLIYTRQGSATGASRCRRVSWCRGCSAAVAAAAAVRSCRQTRAAAAAAGAAPEPP